MPFEKENNGKRLEEKIQEFVCDGNITHDDISSIFVAGVLSYLTQYGGTGARFGGDYAYYFIKYHVYTEPEYQNFNWAYKVVKHTSSSSLLHIYMLTITFSNGWFSIYIGNHSFCVEKEYANKIITFKEGTVGRGEIIQNIETKLHICMKESELAWKMNKKKIDKSSGYNEYPFPVLLLSE